MYAITTNELNKLLAAFNVNRLPEIYNVPESYMAYVFFTRPELNIFNSQGVLNSYFATSDTFANHRVGADNMAIMKSLTALSPSVFVPILTSRAKGFSPDARSLRTIEKGSTFLGMSVGYGIHNNDHRKGRSVSFEFANDKHLFAYKYHSIWRDYIDAISFRSNTGPLKAYMTIDPTLDYAASFYYFVCKRNTKKTIVYWQKGYGIFPISVPDDIFASSNNAPIYEQNISITYHCSMLSDPNSIDVLEDFNYLSKDKTLKRVDPLMNDKVRGTKIMRDVMAKYPYVAVSSKKDEFYLVYGGEVA